ncbi:transmembrane protein, putative (macronuclear) [Tetrahymena thermophila SB210]|uniref:Transmembrane protein, putative n=1 Tax=Tetrahymena thermophila (strain SB210) TaxID=312017 RepID=W7X2Q6_TETTS|nr:transmembrane protein, putative [Tetrahymena thermophila SB210]EWS73570.1 transmembrane protein, putative [Tetrahymena thermophila SB210]|eukprot:XP_012653893.1 transmembrane protein, putative [Tetrahymena thermophila SB210]
MPIKIFYKCLVLAQIHLTLQKIYKNLRKSWLRTVNHVSNKPLLMRSNKQILINKVQKNQQIYRIIIIIITITIIAVIYNLNAHMKVCNAFFKTLKQKISRKTFKIQVKIYQKRRID